MADERRHHLWSLSLALMGLGLGLACDPGASADGSSASKSAEKTSAKQPASAKQDTDADKKADAKQADKRAYAKQPPGVSGEANADAGGLGAAADPVADPPTPPATPTVPFAEGIAKIPGNGTDYADAAIALFRAHYQGAPGVEESQLRRDLDLLIETIGSNLKEIGAAADADADRTAAACWVTGQCDSGEPSAKAKAWIELLRKSAITFTYAGEGTTLPAVDLVALGEQLEPALSDRAAAYLDAKALEDKALSAFDEGGYAGDPKVLVDAIIAFETLGKTGTEAYADGKDSARSLARSYLTMSVAPFFDERIAMPKEHRESYAAFLADHRGSDYAPAVEAFVAALKKAKFKAKGSKFEAMADKAMKKARGGA